MEDFVQSKFIEGQTGQKFSFQDKIIMNLADQKQYIHVRRKHADQAAPRGIGYRSPPCADG